MITLLAQSIEELKSQEQEMFIVVSLNKLNKIISSEIVAIGTLDRTYLHPRDVFRNAIRNNAHKIILVHNHPSGDCTPSYNDIETTKELLKVGNILGVEILDHIILGEEGFFSFKEIKNYNSPNFLRI